MPFNHFEVEASSDLSARHFWANDQVVYDPRAFYSPLHVNGRRAQHRSINE